MSGAGGEDPGLFVSAWNVAQLTRQEALEDYLAENPGVDAEDIDLDGRTTAAFETYWQSKLGSYSYGAEHPGMILEGFSTYAQAGMEAGAAFGTDVIHPGRLSLRDEDGNDHVFSGGKMYEMLRESVVGTVPLEESDPYDPNAPGTLYGFEDDDKLVVFIASGEDALGDVELNIEGLGSTFIGVWADSLETEFDEDWQDTFGIPDTEGVDETPEGWTYATGVQNGLALGLTTDGVSLHLDAPHEVARLAFAKTEAGAQEIAGWSEGTELPLVMWEVLDESAGATLSAEATAEEDDDSDGTLFGDDLGSMLSLLTLLPLLFV